MQLAAPPGTVRYGNMPPGSDLWDSANNVQRVDWRDIPEGDYQVTVTRDSSMGGEQVAYGLVWYLSS